MAKQGKTKSENGWFLLNSFGKHRSLPFNESNDESCVNCIETYNIACILVLLCHSFPCFIYLSISSVSIGTLFRCSRIVYIDCVVVALYFGVLECFSREEELEEERKRTRERWGHSRRMKAEPHRYTNDTSRFSSRQLFCPFGQLHST